MPKLRCRWDHPGQPAGDRFTAVERDAIWDHAARTAPDAAAHVRSLAGTDPSAAADAAWATADTLHVAAAAHARRILRQAADAYDRAARAPYGRIPRPSPTGNSLRQAARLISAFALVSDGRSVSQIMLITRLAALAEAVSALRQSQQHAAQAASALRAAEQLRVAASSRKTLTSEERVPVQSAPGLADAGFPVSARPLPADSPASTERRRAPPNRKPSPRRGR